MFDSSSSFGQSSMTTCSQFGFGQINNAQSRPFGSSNPFGSSSGSSLFGGTSTGAFGQLSTSSFGVSPSAFGTSSIPGFGSSASLSGGSTQFGQNTSIGGFGSTPNGSTLQPTQPTLGSNAFGSTKPFGALNQPTFGLTCTPSFTQTPVPPGCLPFAVGTRSSSSVAPTNAFMFGSQGIGQGSRVAKYSSTAMTEQINGKWSTLSLRSMSAMPVCDNKSHEELRWEDYERGDKGGSSFGGQPVTNLFSSTISFGQTNTNSSPNLVPSISPLKTSSFSPTNPSGHTSTNTFPNPVPTISPNPFGQNNTNPVPNPTPTISPANTNPFSPTIPFRQFGLTTVNSLPHPEPTITACPVGPTSVAPISNLMPMISPFGPNPFSPTNPLGQTDMNSFSNPSSTIPANPAGQTGANTTSSNPAHSFPANLFGVNPSGQFGRTRANACSSVALPSISTVGSTGFASATTSNPWGTLPALPQMFPRHLGSAPSVRHGISRMPVAEKSTSIRISTLAAPRHLSQRRISLPIRKYNAKIVGSKVPFFMDDEETKTSPKVDALFTPRENPRLLVIRPVELWLPRQPVLKDMKNPSENASPDENDNSQKEADLSDNRISEHREGEAAIAYSADFEPLLPKLCHADYYTEPRVEELAGKERVEPGFCSHVKDFVVGRHGYGSIRFDGETDVRRLDLESIIQFNNKEVIVYKDVSKKPPVGQGLNKAAEVTLRNIKCINKKTGQHYTEGQRVDKFKDMLMKKTEEQGAEFVFFDAVKGLWKFKVQHF